MSEAQEIYEPGVASVTLTSRNKSVTFVDQETGEIGVIPRLKAPSVLYATYMEDPKLAALADVLIDRHSLHAGSFRVAYRWKKKGGKCYGKCVKAPELLTHFHGVDVVIWLAADTTRTDKFTAEQLEALLYHELRHIGMDEDGNLKLIDHEYEGFRDELDIYGAWHPAFAAAKPHFEQASLLTD